MLMSNLSMLVPRLKKLLLFNLCVEFMHYSFLCQKRFETYTEKLFWYLCKISSFSICQFRFSLFCFYINLKKKIKLTPLLHRLVYPCHQKIATRLHLYCVFTLISILLFMFNTAWIVKLNYFICLVQIYPKFLFCWYDFKNA